MTDQPALPVRFQPPRAAYIHVPFCRHRCGYCNFTLVAGRDDLVDAYLDALSLELSWLEVPREVDTLYFGGGTPTHLPPASLKRLCEIARQWFVLSGEGAEFSVEANPLDVTPQRLDILQVAGVTRISLGAQSFSKRKLSILERDHRGEGIECAVRIAQQAGLIVSIDLIFGTPQESLDEWRDDLAAAAALDPQHISAYGLTWERGTSFWSRRLRGELAACPEDQELRMYELARSYLRESGFEHYEVSNFARPGFRCRHNEAYWMGRTYFAAGPGAARHIAGRRETNHRSTTTYLRRVLAGQSPVADTEFLSPEDAARERLVFELRRLDGVAPAQFLQETGFEVRALAGETLGRYLAAGWLAWSDDRLRLTDAGLMVSDSLWPAILAP